GAGARLPWAAGPPPPAAGSAPRSPGGPPPPPAEMWRGPPFDWPALRKALAWRDVTFGRTFPITFAALAPLAFVARENRRQAAFHALVVVLFSALAVEGPILRLYLALPMGRIFRLPARFLCAARFAPS